MININLYNFIISYGRCYCYNNKTKKLVQYVYLILNCLYIYILEGLAQLVEQPFYTR